LEKCDTKYPSKLDLTAFGGVNEEAEYNICSFSCQEKYGLSFPLIPEIKLPELEKKENLTELSDEQDQINEEIDCAAVLLSEEEIQEIIDKANEVSEAAGGLNVNSFKKTIFALEAVYKTNKEPSYKSYFDKELLEKEVALNDNQDKDITPSVSISNFAKYIVRVVCADSDRDNPNFTSGSGTIFGLNRFIITNSHVVEGMILCSIGLTDDIKNPPSRWYEAEVSQNIPSLDIALLGPSELLPTDTATIAYNLCNSKNIDLGDPVVILGYPTIGGNTITATEGVISGFDGLLIKTSAKIEHGNSGGGAFLKDENCWFGIPTSVVQGDLESLGYIINYSLIHEQSSQ